MPARGKLSRSILGEVSIVVTPNYSTLAILIMAAVPLCAQQDADAVLKSNCLPCHNLRNRSSGLALDSRDAALTGGARGPAIKPGAPDESLLIRAVEQSGDLKMPPAGRLKDEQIAILRQWISQNAVWPD